MFIAKTGILNGSRLFGNPDYGCVRVRTFEQMTGMTRIMWPKRFTAAFVYVAIVALFYFLYGSTTRRLAIESARADVARRASLEIETLVSDVEKFRVLPFVLVELPDARAAADRTDKDANARLNRKLDTLAEQTGASVIYVVDRFGTARAASNAGRPDSFLGHSFKFRPYFLQAMSEGASEYFAEGYLTRRTGLFLARRAGPEIAPYGVVVVKIEFDRLEKLWRSKDHVSFVLDKDGVIIISTDASIRFKTTEAIGETRRREIMTARQFGNASLAQSGMHFLTDGFVRDSLGTEFIAVSSQLPILGWRHVHLEPMQPIVNKINDEIRFATTGVGLSLLMFGSIFYWMITRQRRLTTARDTLELEVARRTIQLSDTNAELVQEASERERASKLYRAAREELAQANRLGSIGTITTSVAHEINQPVAAIRTAAENATKLLARDQHRKVAENLALIVDMTTRIGSITGELLSYGRRRKGSAKPVTVDEIIEGALLLVTDSFERSGVDLEVAPSKALALVNVSRIRAEQVLVNVLQNALDALEGRSGALVRLDVTVQGQFVQITVTDNGPGIAPNLQETIFQPFVTGKRDGTGLGLGISREIVEEYGGSLEIMASPLGGAGFCITLPSIGKLQP
jgi:two-component system, NtrC family, C4-dicarboxylate transport sensor histidine kinase DctB